MKTSSHFHMEHVLSHDPSEQRHLAQQGALGLGRQAAFRMTQVAATVPAHTAPTYRSEETA